MSRSKTVAILPKGHKRYVIYDEEGNPVEAWAAKNEKHAWELFAHPALNWKAYKASGWKAKEVAL